MTTGWFGVLTPTFLFPPIHKGAMLSPLHEKGAVGLGRSGYTNRGR